MSIAKLTCMNTSHPFFADDILTGCLVVAYLDTWHFRRVPFFIKTTDRCRVERTNRVAYISGRGAIVHMYTHVCFETARLYMYILWMYGVSIKVTFPRDTWHPRCPLDSNMLLTKWAEQNEICCCRSYPLSSRKRGTTPVLSSCILCALCIQR